MFNYLFFTDFAKYTLHKYNHNRSIKQNFEAIETILEAFDKAATNILGEIVGENFDFELDGSIPYRYMNIKSEMIFGTKF